jgi:hypothetical protein
MPILLIKLSKKFPGIFNNNNKMRSQSFLFNLTVEFTL